LHRTLRPQWIVEPTQRHAKSPY